MTPPFTDEDLKKLKERIEFVGGNDGLFAPLVARLEAAEQLANALEAFCEIECPDCGCELADPHESDCETGKHLEAWRKSKGEL